jgi:hypothetical protein
MSYSTYVRNRASWMEVYQRILEAVVTPIDYKPEDLKRKTPMAASDYLEARVLVSNGQLCLEPKEKDASTRNLYRCGGVVAALWGVFVFATEVTVCISAEYTVTNMIAEAAPEHTFVNFVVGVLFLSGLMATCFFSIVNARISETIYKLRPG